MSQAQWIFLATAIAGLGMWLLLPKVSKIPRALGAVLSVVAVGLFAAQMPSLSSLRTDVIFYALVAVTVVSAAGAITFKSPVYCALWFALSVLGTAGMFLFSGAQFLGIATVVVYAGAIVVTFLFVLMLAQPEGHSYYDRMSWEPTLSAFTGALMVCVLTLVISGAFRADQRTEIAKQGANETQRAASVLAEEHVATLGARLFSEHLIAVQLIGLLMMVALIGASAIVLQGRQESVGLPRQEPLPGGTEQGASHG